MRANVGGVDRMIRLLAGAGLLAWGMLGGLASPWNYVADGVGVVMMLTALIRFCPLYPILGVNTCGGKKG